MRRLLTILLAVALCSSSGCFWAARLTNRGTAPAATPVDAYFPVVSGDGRYVAYVESDDGGATGRVVRRDVRTGAVVRVDAGTPVAARPTDISADGRYVVYESLDGDAVPGDTNGVQDVFVGDVELGTVVRVSALDGGGQPDGPSGNGHITEDGSTVVFSSSATNWFAPLPSGPGIYARDLSGGVTELYRASAGSSFFLGGISDDGRSVAFDTTDPLEPGDTDGVEDVYVLDTDTGTFHRVHVFDIDWAEARVLRPSIAGDGDILAFDVVATAFGTGAVTNHVYLWDRVGGGVLDLTNFLPALPVVVDLWSLDISDDGRQVLFSDGIGVDANVFVADLEGFSFLPSNTDGFFRRISGGVVGDLSDDGRVVAFSAVTGPNGVDEGLGANRSDVYVRAAVQPHVSAVTPTDLARGGTVELEVSGRNLFDAFGATVSGDGVAVGAVDVVSDTEARITVSVAPDAPTGPRDLYVWSSGPARGDVGSTVGGCQGCVTVT